MRIVALLGGGLATFVLVFFLALYLHFPGQAAADRLSWQVQEASGGKWLIQAADARIWRGAGLALEDVVLFKREAGRKRAAEGTESPAVPVLRVDDLALRARLLPLLRGERSAAFAAELYGGHLDGVVGQSATERRLRLDGADIDLARIPLEGEDWSIDATGALSVVGDLALGVEEIKESQGELKIELTDLVFQQATVMGMTLEPTPFTEAVLAFEVKEGKAEVTQGRFTSEPVDITVKGEVVLNKALERSRLKLELEVRFSEQFDKLARMAPDLKSARDEDGVYHFKVSGTLDSPRLREDRTVTRSRSVVPSRLSGDAPDAEGPEGEEDAEARREARRERIAERRKRMMDAREGKDGEPQPGLPPLPGELGALPLEGGLPTAKDRRPLRSREEVLDVELDEPDPQAEPFDPGMDEEPVDDLPQDEVPLDEEY
ncbi:type II secretion system protein GspN [Myxococcota bacterium]|nr:type II secretion system protein GspN [Myxococcota bacterium]